MSTAAECAAVAVAAGGASSELSRLSHAPDSPETIRTLLGWCIERCKAGESPVEALAWLTAAINESRHLPRDIVLDVQKAAKSSPPLINAYGAVALHKSLPAVMEASAMDVVDAFVAYVCEVSDASLSAALCGHLDRLTTALAGHLAGMATLPLSCSAVLAVCARSTSDLELLNASWKAAVRLVSRLPPDGPATAGFWHQALESLAVAALSALQSGRTSSGDAGKAQRRRITLTRFFLGHLSTLAKQPSVIAVAVVARRQESRPIMDSLLSLSSCLLSLEEGAEAAAFAPVTAAADSLFAHIHRRAATDAEPRAWSEWVNEYVNNGDDATASARLMWLLSLIQVIDSVPEAALTALLGRSDAPTDPLVDAAFALLGRVAPTSFLFTQVGLHTCVYAHLLATGDRVGALLESVLAVMLTSPSSAVAAEACRVWLHVLNASCPDRGAWAARLAAALMEADPPTPLAATVALRRLWEQSDWPASPFFTSADAALAAPLVQGARSSELAPLRTAVVTGLQQSPPDADAMLMLEAVSRRAGPSPSDSRVLLDACVRAIESLSASGGDERAMSSVVESFLRLGASVQRPPPSLMLMLLSAAHEAVFRGGAAVAWDAVLDVVAAAGSASFAEAPQDAPKAVRLVGGALSPLMASQHWLCRHSALAAFEAFARSEQVPAAALERVLAGDARMHFVSYLESRPPDTPGRREAPLFWAAAPTGSVTETEGQQHTRKRRRLLETDTAPEPWGDAFEAIRQHYEAGSEQARAAIRAHVQRLAAATATDTIL